MAGDEDGYRWEKGYEKTWEVLDEDDPGLFQAKVDEIIKKAKRQQLEKERCQVKLGIMRYCVVCIDLTNSMGEMDLKPSRLLCVISSLKQFITDFFYHNPISQLSLVAMEDRFSHVLTEMSGNSRKHCDVLQSLSKQSLKGEVSLQNTIEVVERLLSHIPKHAAKEAIIVMSSLTSCDAGDVHATISAVAQSGIRFSVIGLSAEVHLCTHLSTATHGSHSVALDESHLRLLLSTHCHPQASGNLSASALVRMGFPYQAPVAPSLCSCTGCSSATSSNVAAIQKKHNDSSGLACPQCGAKVCELPNECRICGLPLLTGAHLARAYCYLFPLPAFRPLSQNGNGVGSNAVRLCFGCTTPLKLLTPDSTATAFTCPNCSNIFCADCDMFIHGTLHSCPGCKTAVVFQPQSENAELSRKTTAK